MVLEVFLMSLCLLVESGFLRCMIEEFLPFFPLVLEILYLLIERNPKHDRWRSGFGFHNQIN